MARSKYYTLSTGYKVEIEPDENATDRHMRNAILGECLTEVRKTTQPMNLDHFNDILVRRIIRECEYVSARYNLMFWRMLGAMMERLNQAMLEMLNSVEVSCDDCDKKEHCKARGSLTAPCRDTSEMN